jgi:hypothetical protein
MLKVVLPAALIGIAVFVAAVMVLTLSSSSPPPHQQAGEGSAANQNGKEGEKRELHKTLWERTTEDPVAFFTFWLVIFTGLLFVVAGLQVWLLIRAEDVSLQTAQAAKESADAAKEAADANRAAVRLAENTAQRQLRAYVNFYDITSSEIAEGRAIAIRINMRNFGQTPAYDVVNLFGTVFDVIPSPKPFPHKSDRSRVDYLSKTTLGPSAPMSVTVQIAPIPADKMAAFRAGKYALYLYGELIYRDAFGKTHHLHYRALQGGGPQDPPGYFSGAEDGNYEETEE